jgi:hypothetical protein
MEFEGTRKTILVPQIIVSPLFDMSQCFISLISVVSADCSVNARPICDSNTGKWATALDAASLSIMRKVCADTAAGYGYRLSDG